MAIGEVVSGQRSSSPSRPVADSSDDLVTASGTSQSARSSDSASFMTASQQDTGDAEDATSENEANGEVVIVYVDSDSELSELGETPEVPEDLQRLLRYQAREQEAPTTCQCESWCNCPPKYLSYFPKYLSNATLDTHMDGVPVSAVRSTVDSPGVVNEMDAAEQMQRTHMYEKIYAALREVRAAGQAEVEEVAFARTGNTLAQQILNAAAQSTTEGPRPTESAARILEVLRSKSKGKADDGGKTKDDGRVANGGSTSEIVWDFIEAAVAGHPDMVLQLRDLLPANTLEYLCMDKISEGDLRREIVVRLPFERSH
ncbi:hypothetical protein Tdes44962_MAKER04368 [Teratosphaeria destructans]|uniref:Uncharacterized protein n=1 Tax=Teratosphaeria destructans TaxID=418781 RepID=A0A9W7SMD4_9PEZI|nr:hypothetical protein Tdes44962_MAKER04368 [Teratosphaeria destructans]